MRHKVHSRYWRSLYFNKILENIKSFLPFLCSISLERMILSPQVLHLVASFTNYSKEFDNGIVLHYGFILQLM